MQVLIGPVYLNTNFENAARNIYARMAGRSFFCIQALQADPEISLEQLSD